MGGIPENHPVTCEHYLRKKLVHTLGIPAERYISFQSNPTDPEQECKRIRSRLEKEGPIDLCILGLGRNGHLGLNEPAIELSVRWHVARLSEESLLHPMIASLNKKPEYGPTLGMEEILSSRQIIILLSGKEKKAVAKLFLESNVSSKLPASYLWKHDQTECLVDKGIQD